MSGSDADDVREDTVIVSSAERSVALSRSTDEALTPESIVDEVAREAESRYEIESLTAGTVLGVVAYDADAEEIESIDWEESPGDEPS